MPTTLSLKSHLTKQKAGTTVLQAHVSGHVIGRKGTLPDSELQGRQEAAKDHLPIL